jgi:anti-anti-sigma regulatory factor
MNTIHPASPLAPAVESTEPPRSTVVLQPHGSLGHALDATFANSLHQALDQADEVIVDLLWVEQIDQAGITLLLASIEKAKSHGKLLSFLSMDGTTRATLDQVLDQQHDLASTVQSECFMPDFEQFLETYKAEQATLRSPAAG